VSKYSADIEIAVRGGQQLDRTIKTLNRLNNSINLVTRNAKLLEGKGFNVASIENYSRAVSKAERAVRKAAEGTNQERQAITALVSAMELENRARERKNILIAREIANQRRVVATANAGVGMQGPAIPAFMRTGPSSPIRGSRAIPGSPAALAAGAPAGRAGGGGGGRLGGAISGSIIGGAFPLLFGQGAGAAAGGAVGGLVGGLAGPGGSFAGSLLGTLLGDIASKGQQIKELGADIGFSAEQTTKLQEAFKLAGQDADKFTAAVQNIRGLGLSIEDQADAINLVSQLTETYGGRIDKVTSAFANAIESGKVNQATLNQLTNEGITVQDALAQKYGVSRSAILQMAKDGKISVQALVDILVEMGNKGVEKTAETKSGFDKLKTSVDSLGSALVALGNSLAKIFEGPFNFILEGLALITKTAAESINIISDLLKFSDPTKAETAASIQAGRMPRGGKQSVIDVIGQERLSKLEGKAGPGFLGLGTDVSKVLELLKQEPEFKLAKTKIGKINVPSQLPPSGKTAKGPKPPEDRTQQLIEEFNAIVAIGKAEDQIRDLLFDGGELLAAELELAQQLADIERDRNKALLGANYESEKAVINKIAEARIVDAQLQTEDKIRAIKQQRFEKELDIQDAVRSSVQVFTDLRQQQDAELQYAKTYSRLVMEGLLPAEAARLANFEQLVNEQLKAVETQLTITQAAILEAEARGMSVTKLQEELDLLTKKKQAIEGAAATGPGEGPTDAQRLQDAIATARGELNDLTDPINQVIAGAKAIGDAFQQAFMGLVSGAMTGQQALAAFFQGVGDHFLDMASKMIAKLIEIYILETVLGFISGSFGSGGGGGDLGQKAQGIKFNPKAFSMPKLAAEGAYWPGGFSAFADGGVVTKPTMGLVGEGGEPEYIIPASKMSAAMKRYGGGARGSAVIPTSGDTSEAGGNATAVNGAIDVRYTVERINSVDYVTADQFQQGMQQAAMQGAQRGEQMVLRKLQQSPSTRRRVGVS
jgi:tape measure domain-containing protein